jgi:hypothetical protein
MLPTAHIKDGGVRIVYFRSWIPTPPTHREIGRTQRHPSLESCIARYDHAPFNRSLGNAPTRINQLGSKKLIALATDQGLNRARDICLVGSDRAVVTLSDSALVMAPNGVTVLVGMHGRCAWDGSSLYLLNKGNRGAVPLIGQFWTVIEPMWQRASWRCVRRTA